MIYLVKNSIKTDNTGFETITIEEEKDKKVVYTVCYTPEDAENFCQKNNIPVNIWEVLDQEYLDLKG